MEEWMVRVGKARSLAAAQKAFNDHEQRRRRTEKRLAWKLRAAVLFGTLSWTTVIWLAVRYAG